MFVALINTAVLTQLQAVVVTNGKMFGNCPLSTNDSGFDSRLSSQMNMFEATTMSRQLG